MTTLTSHFKMEKHIRDLRKHDAASIYAGLSQELQECLEEQKNLKCYLEKYYVFHNKVPYVVDNYLPILEDIKAYHNSFLLKPFYSSNIKRLHKIAPRVFHKFPDSSCVKALEDYDTITRIIIEVKKDMEKFKRTYSHIIEHSLKI